jgi:hypothetical protein
MIKKKPFVLRVNPEILSILQKWADDEFRSINGQIEYLLQKAITENKKNKSNFKNKLSLLIVINVINFLF